MQKSREKGYNAVNSHQEIVKKWFDKKSFDLGFKKGDLVLKYNKHSAKPYQHSKFDTLWEGPFHITNWKEHNAFELKSLEGEVLGIHVNGIHLKQFN